MTCCLCICVSLQLGEATIHFGPTVIKAYSTNRVSIYVFCILCWALFTCYGFRIIAAARQFRECYFILHFCFLFLALVGKTIDLPVFLVASVTFSFCVISHVEFQSCSLTHVKVVILVLKPYILLYEFIFDRPYYSRILYCTLDSMYVHCICM